VKRLAVMVSGGGTDLQSVINGVQSGKIPAEIAVVISSKPGVYALERAKKAGIPGVVICKKDYADEQAFFDANLGVLREYGAEGVVLAGYLSILGKQMIEAYPNKIINIHPSLIPSFCGKGYYGLRVHQAVLDYGAKVSGATVHFVDEGADTGPIILQQAVSVLPEDTAESLQQRILEVEHEILPEAVALFCAGRLLVQGRKVTIR
jgi:phosphoribosylglycinamide formyltransferase-1